MAIGTLCPQCLRQRKATHHMSGADVQGSVGAKDDLHRRLRSTARSAAAFHEEPVDVVLRKIMVAMVGEAVVDQPQIPMTIEDLAAKVTLEEAVGVAPIRNRHRGRVVILAN